MKRIHCLLIMLLVSFLYIGLVEAKRAGAPMIDPLIYKDLKIVVPNTPQRMGYIEAYDVNSGERLWEKKVYDIEFEPMLEQDVQWVFIKNMRIENEKLIVIDEQSKEYIIDINIENKNKAHFWESEKGVVAMKLEIDKFSHNQNIPSEYTCDGQDISPAINWSGLPAETKSLALTVIDPDAPMGNFVHWLVYDIPKEAAGIPRGGPLPKEAKEVRTDFSKTGYGGPCPPSGTHRYFFTLYALDIEHLDGITSANFLAKVKERSIAQTEIIGLYSRKK